MNKHNYLPLEKNRAIENRPISPFINWIYLNFLLLALTFLAITNLSGQTSFVDTDATGNNDGTSWTDAFTDLQDALSLASTSPAITEIWVAEGTYKTTSGTARNIFFVMQNGLAIYGGFAGGETTLGQRDWAANVCTLSGDIGAAGKGDNSYHVIHNNSNNLNSSALLDGFTVSGGNANTGAAFNLEGGGVRNKNSSPAFSNCIFSANSARNGGGMFNASSNPILVNCTFSANSVIQNGSALFNSSSSPTITNCITWGSFANDGSSSPTVTYSIVQGGQGGTGNLNQDPLFADAAGGDFSLTFASPALDAGDDTANSGTLDLAGNNRKFQAIPGGTQIDMGAYEFQSILSTPTISAFVGVFNPVIVSEDFNGIDVGSYSAPTFTDIDGDGLLDLIIGEQGGRLNHYEQDAINSTSFTFITASFLGIDVGSYSAPTFTDIDGDGLLDILIGEHDGNVNHYEQDAINSTSFTLRMASFNGIDVGSRSTPTFTDLDGDDRLDLFIGEHDGNVNLYEQDAINSTVFTFITSSFLGIDVGAYSAPTFTDIDGDGLLDILIGERDGNVNHYEQNAINSTSFTLRMASFNGIDVGNNSAPIFTDLDGDGLLDLLIGELSGNINHYEQTQGTIDPFTALANIPSDAQVVKVYGSNLVGDITVTASSDFEVSLSPAGTYASSVSIPDVSGSVLQDSVYIRLKSKAVGTYNGDLTVTSTSANSFTFPLSGLVCVTSLEVTNTDDSGCGSLRQTALQAASGDTITFASSINGDTITLTSGEIDITKNLTIIGNDTSSTIISAGYNSRVFNIDGDTHVTLRGVNIQRGFSDDGGAIYSNGNLTIQRCLIANSISSNNGGAIYANDTLSIDSSAISYNHADDDGGGIYTDNQSKILLISNSLISNNDSDESGGGVYARREVTLTRNTISGNSSVENGGGIYTDWDATFIDNLISDNSSVENGGGVFVESQGTFSRNTISGNSSQQDGGGIYIDDDDNTFVSDIIYGNKSIGNGGGIYIASDNQAFRSLSCNGFVN
ncbi:MAG: FG-GAP-like repeat-containing protein [Saprospiraceae bacterium]